MSATLRLLMAALVLAPLLARAQGELAPPDSQGSDAGTPQDLGPTASDADKAAAKKMVEDYLNAVKVKKWDVARKLTHPKTLDLIADLKKRHRVEDHEMAPWAKLNESYLVSFELGEPIASAKGAVVVPSTESVFSVEDKGTEDGVQAAYLVIPLDGKWYVTDRRQGGESLFVAATVPQAFKGYFQGEYVPAPPAPAAPKKDKKTKEPEE